MKYSACINIINEEGNIIHERELSADEIIDELLRREALVAGEGGVAGPEPQAPDAGSRTRTPGEIRDAVLRDLAEGILTPGKIAEKHGIAASKVYSIKAGAKKKGDNETPVIPEATPFSMTTELEERIKDMRQEDLTTTEIAQRLSKELGVEQTVLRKHIEKIPARAGGTPPPGKRGRALSEPEYLKVKEMYASRSMSPVNIAASLDSDITLQQVNRAILSTTFEKYLEHAHR